jgi:uncharacterized protein YigA (DUF484 family)
MPVAAASAVSASDLQRMVRERTVYISDEHRLAEIVDLAETNSGTIIRAHDVMNDDEDSSFTIMPNHFSKWRVVEALGA